MLKDIEQPQMEGICMAIIPEIDPEAGAPVVWDCYLINKSLRELRDVLVTSRGYGHIHGEPRQSSTLRYFYARIKGEMTVKLEILPTELLSLNNEYWVSFSRDGHMYDRKFLFVEGSLRMEHMTPVPVFGTKGVLIA